MQQGFDSGPAAPVAVAISEPPIAPVAVSFDSSPQTEPAAPAPRRSGSLPGTWRRLAAWAIDLGFVGAFAGLDVAAAARLVQRDEAFVIAGAAAMWLLLTAGLAFAWSWVFIAFCARTPGMAAAGLRLQTLQGKPPGPTRALLRALLALAFALPGLFGFVLSLFDPRGQTLHDRLCGCVTVVD